MRGRKQSALRPDQERLLVVFLSAAVASSELPEPRDERPARSGRVGISRVTRRTRGESPVLARAQRPLPVPAWEHRDPSSSEGKTNRSSSPLKKKNRRKAGMGVEPALQSPFGTSLPLLLHLRANLEPQPWGTGPVLPLGAQSSPCLSQLGSTHGNCERLSVLQGEAPPRRL